MGEGSGMPNEMLDALLALRKKYKDIPKLPDALLVNWHSWCKLRRMLKEAGIPVEYRRAGNSMHWNRYIEGVYTAVRNDIDGDGVYVIRIPKPTLPLRMGFEFSE